MKEIMAIGDIKALLGDLIKLTAVIHDPDG